MQGTRATSNRERKRRPRVGTVILMRDGALARLYAGTGLTGYREIAADLGYLSVGNLNDADHGKPVNIDLVAVIRNRFPLVRFEEVFTEGVRTDAPPRRAAA